MPDTLAHSARHPTLVALYRAFSRQTIPEALSYCTYCDDAEYERSLHAPLATLPRALVSKYLGDAIHHTGTAEDFRYFVPRIIELECESSLMWWFVFADRLKMADFAAWPEEQRDAVLRAVEHAASTIARDESWLEVVLQIDGVRWPWIFTHWPELDDPSSSERLRMSDALEWGGLLSASSPVCAIFEAFRESAEGKALAARLK